NLPYNIAVPVVLHLLAEVPTLATGLVMVQAEVADRLAAGPGSRTYGVPSVKAAWYADVRRAGTVPRTVFWPVPNVDSALVAFTRRPAPSSDVDRAVVFSLVDAAFAQRRKTLRAALAGWAGSADAAGGLLAAAGLPAAARGEQLDVGDFTRLAAMAVESGVRAVGKA
ncbi:MAG TPA: rRNA adenine dimethyltransferase family protein, partial [Pseudonocardiaceae bacterium]|nr:rRNA adenine dimethyltransferase family protein [Pseudonocardiaceae bacterium]